MSTPSHTPEFILETIRNIIEKQRKLPALSMDLSLFSTGFLDSVSLLELIEELEHIFAIQIHWTEMSLDNFDSIAKIQNFIQQKLAPQT